MSDVPKECSHIDDMLTVSEEEVQCQGCGKTWASRERNLERVFFVLDDFTAISNESADQLKRLLSKFVL